MDPRQVAKLRELLRAATPIPWTLSSASQEDAPNAALIVAAVNALPLLLSSPDPVAGDGLDPARLLRAMYARLPYDNWTFTPEANASSVAREYDRLTAAAPLSSPVEPPPGLDEAWRKAEAAVGRHMPGGGFGVEADGPGYRAHAGHEEWHGGYREAWSVTDAELVGDPDDPATPAKALLKLAAALLPTQASDSPEKTT